MVVLEFSASVNIPGSVESLRVSQKKMQRRKLQSTKDATHKMHIRLQSAPCSTGRHFLLGNAIILKKIVLQVLSHFVHSVRKPQYHQ